ncbi:hypothetical protein PM082_007056 [Marasmius tenuissimus]|nr:hypothetical protein PM082_007056 [Marasmius tenuissimus]
MDNPKKDASPVMDPSTSLLIMNMMVAFVALITPPATSLAVDGSVGLLPPLSASGVSDRRSALRDIRSRSFIALTASLKGRLSLVDPRTSLFWNQRNPKQTSWYKCKNQPCLNASPENSIPETFTFEGDEVLDPIPAPRVPTPEQEPTPPSPPLSTSELATSLACLTVAGPSEKPDSPPTAFHPVTPSPLDTPTARTEIPAFVASEATFAIAKTLTNTRPSSAAAHRAPSPTTSTTSTHTSESNTTNMSTSTTSQATLDKVLRAMVKSQKDTQAQLDAIKEAFQSNKEVGKIIAKPSNFKGETWDVAHFLPMFINWAIQEKVFQHSTEKGQLDKRKTIQSTLSFCEGKAGAWAAYYLIQANKVALKELPEDQFPFGGRLAQFEESFKVRFGAANEKVDAIEILTNLKQGNKTATLYSQEFKEAAMKTGLSDADLQIRYHKGLNMDLKQLLVMMELSQREPANLTKLETQACKAERSLQEEGLAAKRQVETTGTTIRVNCSNIPTGNGCTREDFVKAMRGKCYGCRASDHTKANGNHGQDKCNYCAHPGHRSNVCQEKYLGRAPRGGIRRQQISATPFTLFPDEPTPAPSYSPTPMTPTAQISATPSSTPNMDAVTQIAALQQALAQQNTILQQLMQKDF